jgi:hypothetical protein
MTVRVRLGSSLLFVCGMALACSASERRDALAPHDPRANTPLARDRSVVDLAREFTRALPLAASSDPLWRTAPLGPAGTVDLTLTLDASGALVGSQSTGSPGEALASGVQRTLALIHARPFVARGKETRVRVTATVAEEQVHEGLRGDVFAIGARFEVGRGSGFFALTMGRRIDIQVQVTN